MLERLTVLTGRVRDAAARRGVDGEGPLADVLVALEADHGTGPADPDGLAADRVADVADAFALSPLDVDLLAVAAGAEVDLNLALAYGLLAGRPGPGWPSVAVALELAAAATSDPAARARLHPLAPLLRHGLLEVVGDGPALLHQLRVSPRVLGHLIGEDTPDPALAACLTETLPLYTEPAPTLSDAVERGVRCCWVRTPMGAAGAAAAVGAVELAGMNPLLVDLSRAAARGEVAEVVRAATLEAGLGGHALVLLGATALVPADGASTVHLLETCVRPVIAVADRAWQVGWSPRVPFLADAPRLTVPTRAEVWRSALDAAHAEAGVALAVETDESGWRDLLALRLTPEEVLRVARDAALSAVVDGTGLTLAHLRGATRRLGSTDAPAVERTSASFEDLVLPGPAMRDLRRLVAWARHRDEVLAQGPLNGAGGKGSGIAALFGGSPGTGKTLAAHVVADALGLDLYPVDLSAVVDKYIGETEKNLERIFREAESMNVVLFFDEADSLFGARSAVSDARDRYANLEVSYLLQRMEQFDGITILATNLRGNLDEAFQRRLQFMITFPDPDPATRRRLWERHLDHVARIDAADPPDLDLLAEQLDLAGGDIRNIVLAAAYDAAEADGGVLGMRHLGAAAVRELAKLRKRPPAKFHLWTPRSADAPG